MSLHQNMLSYAVHCTSVWGRLYALGREAAPRLDFTSMCGTPSPAKHMTERGGIHISGMQVLHTELPRPYSILMRLASPCWHEHPVREAFREDKG